MSVEAVQAGELVVVRERECGRAAEVLEAGEVGEVAVRDHVERLQPRNRGSVEIDEAVVALNEQRAADRAQAGEPGERRQARVTGDGDVAGDGGELAERQIALRADDEQIAVDANYIVELAPVVARVDGDRAGERLAIATGVALQRLGRAAAQPRRRGDLGVVDLAVAVAVHAGLDRLAARLVLRHAAEHRWLVEPTARHQQHEPHQLHEPGVCTVRASRAIADLRAGACQRVA